MYFRTRAELERKLDDARQLRAETLGGVTWIVVALAGLFLLLRRSLSSRGSGAAHGA